MSEEKPQNLDKVTGFGALNWDILCRTKRLAEQGEEISLKNIYEAPGGSAANTISWMADYLENLSYVGAVGEDSRGERITKKMRQKGIDTSNILIKDNDSTGTAISILDSDNERTLYTFGGAGSSFSKNEINFQHFKKSDLIHTSSFLSKHLLEVQKDISELNNVFSFAPGLLCKKFGLKDLKKILENTNILFINKLELSHLFGNKSIEKSIEKLIELGVGEVSITLGSNGVLVSDGSKLIKEKSRSEKVRDTTGAGDAYSAGYLVAYIDQKNLRKKAKMGVNVAKRCIKKLGGSDYGQSP
ncbi:hypothetical protein C9439_08195 [archaeon SCG-AAA382B04]|nr:hypothetical protein C9439_08195 [archaeon SCG-AAA382B04]